MKNVLYEMEDYIHQLLNITTDDKFNLRIRRDFVLHDTLIAVNRTTFSLYKTIVVRIYMLSIETNELVITA